MLQKDEISQILASAEAHGIEFAELFFEDREETNIPCVESVIQGVPSHLRSRLVSDSRSFKCLFIYQSGDKRGTS